MFHYHLIMYIDFVHVLNDHIGSESDLKPAFSPVQDTVQGLSKETAGKKHGEFQTDPATVEHIRKPLPVDRESLADIPHAVSLLVTMSGNKFSLKRL
jgi:hypothetical protein